MNFLGRKDGDRLTDPGLGGVKVKRPSILASSLGKDIG